MNKSIRLLIPLSVLFIIGCNSTTKPAATPPVTEVTPPTTTQNTPTVEKLPKFFQNSNINYSKPQKVDVLPSAKKDEIVKIYSKFQTVPPTWSDISNSFILYDVGEINSGIYKGQRLIVYDDFCDGICISSNIFRFAQDKTTNTFTLLGKHSSELESEFVNAIADKKDSTNTLAGLNLPEKIKLPGTNQYITMYEKDSELSENFSSLLQSSFINTNFEDADLGTIYYYTSENDPGTHEGYEKGAKFGFGCFYVTAADGTVSRYVYDPKFFAEDAQTTINWTNGDKATSLNENYAFTDTACGTGGACYLIKDIDEKSLVLVGETTNDVKLYEPQDPKNNEEFNSYFETYNNIQDKKLSFDEFSKMHPLLYWKDPMNRWTTMINKAAKPPAECGKPVIYLYPEQTTDVNVQVGIEKLTETIPAYPRAGWNISANPNGQLYNYDDGKTYPYLYWEGQGKGSTTPEKGFVVARNEVDSFLDKSLNRMGLNTTEAADFKDFWVSRILDNRQPYFFFNFMGTGDFNKVAPLTITPTPETLIRIFMYYKPLENKINVQSQTLRAIQRRGFTVVEWGGTSSVPWKK